MGLGPQTLATITVGTTATAVDTTQLAAQLYIEADGGNSGTIFVGDSNLSASRYMTNLAAGKGFWVSAAWPSRPDHSNLQLNSFYVLGSAASQKVHITYFERLGGLT